MIKNAVESMEIESETEKKSSYNNLSEKAEL